MLNSERVAELLDHVQWVLNWDPIGASDLCYDFIQWSHSHDDGTKTPQMLVEEFQKSSVWELYFS